MTRSGLWTALCAAVVAICFTACFAVGSAAAADRPSWQALPDETLFVVRFPSLAGFFEALRSQTKFGAVIADEARVDAFWKLIEDEGGDDFDTLDKALGELGLTADDLRRAAEGEVGYAGLLAPVDGERHTYVGLAWIECGAATTDKWLAAIDRKLAEQEPGPAAVRREDVDVAGRKVIRLTIPELLETATESTAPPGNEAIPAEKTAEVAPIELAHEHVLIARRDDGFVLAHAMSDVFSHGDDGEAAAAARRREAGEDLEATTKVFAGFLQAHGSRNEGIVHQWQQAPGLSSALPDGVVLVDALVDTRRLARLADEPESSDAWKFMQAAGLDAVGPVALRITLDGTIVRSALFASMPAPRTGLQTLVDQATFKPEPAGWVAKTAIGYQQVSCDLGQAYETITRVVRDNLPRGAGMITTLETQSKSILQVEPAALLSALGKTHIVLSYLPEDAAELDDDDGAGRTAAAFVWQIPEEAVWRRLMSMLAKASAKPIDNEQGFAGLRYDEKALTGGWFIGNGFMVVAVGKGVLERVLANLRSTPRSDELLRNTPHAARAAELLPPTGAITYDLTDGAGMMHFIDTVMRQALSDPDDEDAAKLKRLWPTAEEASGTIGVAVSATTVDADGVTYRRILELPSP